MLTAAINNEEHQVECLLSVTQQEESQPLLLRVFNDQENQAETLVDPSLCSGSDSDLNSTFCYSPSSEDDSFSSISTPCFSDISSLETASLSSSCVSTSANDFVSDIPTFKLVGDNVDKYVKPRHETTDRHASSLHYFHMYGVKDRCDISTFEDNPSLPSISNFSSDAILPSSTDYDAMVDNYTVLAARIIQKHIPFFQKNVPPVEQHIPHIHSSEMTKTSDVVSFKLIMNR